MPDFEMELHIKGGEITKKSVLRELTPKVRKCGDTTDSYTFTFVGMNGVDEVIVKLCDWVNRHPDLIRAEINIARIDYADDRQISKAEKKREKARKLLGINEPELVPDTSSTGRSFDGWRRTISV